MVRNLKYGVYQECEEQQKDLECKGKRKYDLKGIWDLFLNI